jgi:hypothetical protein
MRERSPTEIRSLLHRYLEDGRRTDTGVRDPREAVNLLEVASTPEWQAKRAAARRARGRRAGCKGFC